MLVVIIYLVREVFYMSQQNFILTENIRQFLNVFRLKIYEFIDIIDFNQNIYLRIVDSNKKIVGWMHNINKNIEIRATINNNYLLYSHFKLPQTTNDNWKYIINYNIIDISSSDKYKLIGNFKINNDCTNNRLTIYPTISYELGDKQQCSLKISHDNNHLLNLRFDNGNYNGDFDISNYNNNNYCIRYHIATPKLYNNIYPAHEVIHNISVENNIIKFLYYTKDNGVKNKPLFNNYPIKIEDSLDEPLTDVIALMKCSCFKPSAYDIIDSLRSFFTIDDIQLFDNLINIGLTNYNCNDLLSLIDIQTKTKSLNKKIHI